MKRNFTLWKGLVLSLAMVLVASAAWAQSTVSGTVTDGSDGTSLPGVTITIAGTATGTVTNFDGAYSISAQPSDTLVFSFVGYNTERVAVGSATNLDIALMPSIDQLSEVVVIGYGTQDKRELTSTISTVSSEQLQEVTAPSFEAALQGQAAGVQVITGSGMAGSASMVRIRGVASLSAGGDPLYVIDGMPITVDYFLNSDRAAFNNNPLAAINPNDIESISVLKDASATAIYGSRGANGVIIITTKRGSEGKLSVTVDSKVGVSEPTNNVDMLTGREYLTLRQEAWENDGNTGLVGLPQGLTWEEAINNDTDWFEETTRTGIKQEYNLTLSQGTKKLRWLVNGSYSDNESFLRGNSYNRLSGRANVDYQILPNLKARLSTSISRGLNYRVESAWAGGYGAAQSESLPIYPVFEDDGSYWDDGNNPRRRGDLIDYRTRELRTINRFDIEYEPIKNVKVTAFVGYDYMDLQDTQFEPGQAALGAGNTGFTADIEWQGQGRLWPTWVENTNIGGTVEWARQFGGHSLTVLGGYEVQERITTRRNEAFYRNIDAPIFENPTFGPVEGEEGSEEFNVTGGGSGVGSRRTFESVFMRAIYDFEKRYLLKVSLRRDGSSVFGENNKYGLFPTVATGWVLSEESFFNLPVVSFAKLKATYGRTGNADIPGDAQYSSFAPLGSNDIYGGVNDGTTRYQTRLGNPNLQWEVTDGVDMGIELGLFNDRIFTEVNYFYKYSSQVLIDLQIPQSTGFGIGGGGARQWQNVAEIVNRGWEFSVLTKNIQGAFTWETDIKASTLHNEVVELGSTPPDAIAGSGDTRVVEGESVGVNFLNRLSRVDPATGLPIFLDADGNETFSFNLEDRVVVGDVVPELIGSVKNTFSYKGVDLSMMWVFTLGGNIYDDAAKRQLGVVSDWNMRSDILDRWQQPGDIAQFPRLTLNPATYGGMPSFWNYNVSTFLYDASFARMRSLTLGYNLPSNLVDRWRIGSMRFYLTGTNLITITKYPGPDPEVVRDQSSAQGRNLSPNVTYLTVPQERSVVVGVTVNI